MKTSELTGAALDWAVAKCEGNLPDGYSFDPRIHNYSRNWAQGGPIIEREEIAVGKSWESWKAFTDTSTGEGPTPLIAAMRCYVVSKLGESIDLPKESL
jgi:hypothetical protein